jgi:hypothetical protein
MESGYQPGLMSSPMRRISQNDELVLRQLHAFQPLVGDLLRLWRERDERAPV